MGGLNAERPFTDGFVALPSYSRKSGYLRQVGAQSEDRNSKFKEESYLAVQALNLREV